MRTALARTTDTIRFNRASNLALSIRGILAEWERGEPTAVANTDAQFAKVLGAGRGSHRGDDAPPKPRTAEDRRALIEMSLDVELVEREVLNFERIVWDEGEERTAPSGRPAAHYQAFCPFFIEVSVDSDYGWT